MTGAPAYDYLTTAHTADEIWDIVNEAQNNGFIIGCGTKGGGDDSIKNEVGLS